MTLFKRLGAVCCLVLLISSCTTSRVVTLTDNTVGDKSATARTVHQAMKKGSITKVSSVESVLKLYLIIPVTRQHVQGF